ncbi:MAG: glycosyltransferase N-terminal domain-containing protein, partial [Alphaproteobacteria bacterium]|nr:glycosyltransferase N-terminal domain-containing protein [Alphaproteobacteria bacterium]
MIDAPFIIFPLYKAASYALLPALPFYLSKREKRGKELAARRMERYGKTEIQRPYGKLVWIHAASVGEFMSTLSLIKALKTQDRDLAILVTTGTVTSAKIAERDLPEGCIHQFAPLDNPIFIQRFLSHWKPDLVLWLESEFWPNQLAEIRKREIPAILLNARISNKSYEKWKKYPATLQQLLGSFTFLSAQSAADREKLSSLVKGRDVLLPGNLKQAAAPLAFESNDVSVLQENIGDKKVLTFASSHPEEEKIFLDLMRDLMGSLSPNHRENLLIVLIPRHPDRGDEIAQLLEQGNLEFSQRSKGELPSPKTQYYLADSLGEMGLFYHLSDIVLIGGTLTGKTGGHNPIEP